MSPKRVNLGKNNNSQTVNYHVESNLKNHQPVAFCYGKLNHPQGIAKIVGYINKEGQQWWTNKF